MDPKFLEEIRQFSAKMRLHLAKRIVHHLSQKRGGSVPNISTHCKFFNHRPAHIRRSILCSGGGIWEPCTDFQLCLHIKPPSIKEYQEPTEIDLEIIIHKEIMCVDRPVIKRKRGRPRKDPIWKDIL